MVTVVHSQYHSVPEFKTITTEKGASNHIYREIMDNVVNVKSQSLTGKLEIF